MMRHITVYGFSSTHSKQTSKHKNSNITYFQSCTSAVCCRMFQSSASPLIFGLAVSAQRLSVYRHSRWMKTLLCMQSSVGGHALAKQRKVHLMKKCHLSIAKKKIFAAVYNRLFDNIFSMADFTAISHNITAQIIMTSVVQVVYRPYLNSLSQSIALCHAVALVYTCSLWCLFVFFVRVLRQFN